MGATHQEAQAQAAGRPENFLCLISQQNSAETKQESGNAVPVGGLTAFCATECAPIERHLFHSRSSGHWIGRPMKQQRLLLGKAGAASSHISSVTAPTEGCNAIGRLDNSGPPLRSGPSLNPHQRNTKLVEGPWESPPHSALPRGCGVSCCP